MVRERVGVVGEGWERSGCGGRGMGRGVGVAEEGCWERHVREGWRGVQRRVAVCYKLAAAQTCALSQHFRYRIQSCRSVTFSVYHFNPDVLSPSIELRCARTHESR